MTNQFDKLDKIFNASGGNYDEKQSMIDPEKLMEAADRIRQMLQEEKKERPKRLARIEEAADKLRRATQQLFAQVMAQDDGIMDVTVQVSEDTDRARVAGVQEAMASGTTQQLSAPRTARFRLTR